MGFRVKKLTIFVLVLSFNLNISLQAGNIFLEYNSIKSTCDSPVNDSLRRTHNATANAGINLVKLGRIDSIVKAGIKARVFPGCQVLVLKEGRPVYDKCFGNYTYDAVQKVKPTTMYDLASLSKTTGTLLAVMKLYDRGQLKLTDRASNYLPFLQNTDKQNITIKELLFHESGLPAYLPLYKLAVEKYVSPATPVKANNRQQHSKTEVNRIAGTNLSYKAGWVSGIYLPEFQAQASDSIFVSNRFHDAAMERIAGAKLYSKVYRYSCLNFILLKEIVEKISGMSMDVFLNKEFYEPMNLEYMTYLPLKTHKKEEIAPTLKRDLLRKEEIQGYVNDIDAAFLGGVSGNAGLFASAGDVAKVYQMLLNKGELGGKRYLSAETCQVFTTTTSASGRRGLGFDKPFPENQKHNPCSTSTPRAVYGHTGYTGTCCWADPVNNLVYVFLSNRTFPYDGVNKLARSGIRTQIQDVIYQSIRKP